MNNKHYKIVVIALLTIVIGAFTHCVQNSPVGGGTSDSSSRSPSGSKSSTPKTPEQVLNTAQVSVGLKNFEQINYTFSELTGVPVTNGTINNTYNAVQATLPTENSVKVLQASNQVAITRLAAEYCDQLIRVGIFNANRDTLFGTGFFTVPYNNLSAAQVNSFVNRVTNAFWGEGVINQVELDAARAELLKLFDDIAAMDNNTNRASNNITSGVTSKAGRAVCTAALSSAYVTIM